MTSEEYSLRISTEEASFGSVGILLNEAINNARQHGFHMLLIPHGVYHIYAEDCPAPVICPSNHGFNGFHPAAVFLDEMTDFILDGQNSTFILHGVMDFAVIRKSRQVTIRNLYVTYADTCNFQGKVIRSDKEEVQIALEKTPFLELHDKVLLMHNMQDYYKITRTLEYTTATREIRVGTGDNNFGCPIDQLRKSLDGNILTLYDVPITPVVGNTIVFATSRRCGQAFFTEQSSDVKLENITVNTCYGMAFLFQKSGNLTIRSCTVTPERGNCWSAGQDASHFANCRGKICIEECLFENQLDDAVNIHGIYTVLEKKTENRLLVCYPHWQTRGINIYDVGDTIQFQNQRTQQPTGTAVVTAVRVLNPDKTALEIKMQTGTCAEGQIIESLTDQPDAIIRNNIFRNNRARGMLIATKGFVEICSNHFHTNHSAINFESDPLKWFEAGSTREVSIHDNFFDDCLQNRTARAVIDIKERPEMPDGFYYHDKISIRHNRFTQEAGACVFSASVKNLIFKENTYLCASPVQAVHSCVNSEETE